MNKKGMSYMMLILVLACLIIGLTVQQNPDFNVSDFKSSFNWTHIDIDTIESQPDLENAIESAVNGLGEAYFSIAKWAAQWSSENPTVPFKLLVICLILSIFAPILIVLFKILIILFLLTKEFIQSRREKRRLNKMKGGNNNEFK